MPHYTQHAATRTQAEPQPVSAPARRHHRPALRALVVAAGALLVAGCSGGVIGGRADEGGNRGGGGSSGGSTGTTPPGGPGTTPPGGTTPPPGGTTPPPGGTTPPGGPGTMPPGTPAFKPAPATLRRLTLAQYANSVRDLLGSAVTLPTDLEPDTALNGFASIGAARIAFSPRAIEQLETAALALSQQALADPQARASLLPCTPVGPIDDACARQVVTRLGRRAWRRVLTTDEVTRYAGIATSAGDTLKDFFKGLEYAIAGILQSPHFLYREELGTPDAADPSRRVFNGFEVATRLSYFLWNTTPDPALLDAAEAGKLATADGLRAEAERLIASPRAQAATETFFTEVYRLAELDDLPQLPTVFPQMSATMGASMRTETLRVLGDLVWSGDQDFRSFLDTRTTFVNAELARLYGLTPPSGTAFVKTTLPADGQRSGLLGQGSFLALNAHADSTSPTRRGKFIREVLLCQAVPAPPPDVDTSLPPTPPGGTPVTMRQKLDKHRSQPSCASCHKVMDPIGLGFENFDGMGAFRTIEAGQPIDASGEIDGVTFADARGLIAALRNHPEVGTCLSRNLHRFATGHVETAGEESVVVTLSQKFASEGYRFRSLVLGLALGPSFRYTGLPE